MNKLVILDINGLLCKRIDKEVIYDNKLKCIKLHAYNVILRPYYKEFLQHCYNYYHVGIFTSGNHKNTKIILDALLTKEQLKNTAFIWCRDRNRLDPDFNTDIFTTNFDTIKYLQDIYDNPIVNENRIYNASNTLLLDDSYRKCRFNNPNNVMICNTFTGNVNDTYLQQLIHLLQDHPITTLNI